MQPFLESVSKFIFNNYPNTKTLQVILPNKRAGLYLKKYLTQKFGKPIWSPKIYSIDEFMNELSGFTTNDSLTLLFELYSIYKKEEGEKAQPPVEFFRWASILLNDFNEIDSYCINATDLFNYLNEVRAIELWDPSGGELTSFQKQYLHFWKLLGNLYNEFFKSLNQKKQGYQGLAYRTSASTPISEAIKKNKGPFLFIGFNALTKAEEMVIQNLTGTNCAEIIWDADDYYLNNKDQEAGIFLRNYLGSKKFEPSKKNNSFPMGDDLRTGMKEIEIIGVPGNIAQAKKTGEILKEIISQGKIQQENEALLKTAVVLADESLLAPVLNSLPSEINKVNITMGYPLKYTSFHDFWNETLLLHEGVKDNFGKRSFYYKNLLRVISHPVVLYSDEMILLSKKIVSEIKQKNIIYVPLEKLEEIALAFGKKEMSGLLFPLFSDWKNNPDLALSAGINLIKKKISGKNVEDEILTSFLETFHQIQNLQEKFKLISDLPALRLIFNQITGGLTVPFSGEPLTGLQIMGMLETRTLDFENVILLSANEEILPSGKKQNSFIPVDVKRQFGLPTYNDRDAIFSYHFYRLIQKAKKIFILFNNDLSKNFGKGSSEKSRFISQIVEELPRINPNIKITQKTFSFPASPTEKIHLKISKNEQILKRLDELCSGGISPTALNTFLSCPLDFYFKYIACVREKEEVEEVIDDSSMGEFIHLALRDLFFPFIDKIISPSQLEERKKDSEKILENAFLTKYDKKDICFGKNHLSLKVAQKLVNSFLNREINYLSKLESEKTFVKILHLEKEFQTEIQIQEKKVRIKGKVDRIDMVGNTIRVIDYKTGLVIPGEVKIENTEILSCEKTKPKANQLLMYAYLFLKNNFQGQPDIIKAHGNNNGNHPSLISGIISLRKLSAGLMPLMINESQMVDASSLVDFEREFSRVISKMYSSDEFWEHNPESEYCEFCM